MAGPSLSSAAIKAIWKCVLAIDGTGAISEWPLPAGDANREPRTMAPLVLEDGSVVLVSSRYRAGVDWSYELPTIVLPPGASAYSVISLASGSQTRLDVSELRLMPDGGGGLLLTPGKFGYQGGGTIPGTPYPGSVRPDVFRVDTNNTVSAPLQLVPNWGPNGNPWNKMDGIFGLDCHRTKTGVSVAALASCNQFGPLRTAVGRFHTHPPAERNPQPSPGDFVNANNNRALSFYVKAAVPDTVNDTRTWTYTKTETVDATDNLFERVGNAWVPKPYPWPR